LILNYRVENGLIRADILTTWYTILSSIPLEALFSGSLIKLRNLVLFDVSDAIIIYSLYELSARNAQGSKKTPGAVLYNSLFSIALVYYLLKNGHA